MYTKKKCKIYVLSVLLCTFFFSCSSIDFELPQGPQGTNGKSAYEIWKEEVETGHINWPSTQVDLADFLVYIKGEKGDKGKDGMSAYDQWKILITQGNVTNPHDPSLIWPSSKNTEADFWDFLSGRDGESPHIGENGNWYIGNKDTKIKAIGKDGKDGINGKDGLSAYELWKQSVAGGNINWPKDQTTMEHFFLYLKGKDGENGITPHVGENGNWYIGNRDTNFPKKKKKGEFSKLYVMCDSPKISSCCFICRQTISEFFSKDAEIVLYSNDGEKETYLVKDLCPFPFGSSDLK